MRRQTKSPQRACARGSSLWPPGQGPRNSPPAETRCGFTRLISVINVRGRRAVSSASPPTSDEERLPCFEEKKKRPDHLHYLLLTLSSLQRDVLSAAERPHAPDGPAAAASIIPDNKLHHRRSNKTDEPGGAPAQEIDPLCLRV